MLSHKYNNY